MTVSQIECFIEVVQAGSFSKAATYLFMTQQGMSNQIKALETELGFPVFVRLNRGVELTAEGKILYEYWKGAYSQLKIGIDKAKDEYAGGRKNIHIGIQDVGVCSEDIMAGFLEYEKQYDDLRIQFEIMSPRQMLKQFEDDTLDMAVLYASEFANVKHLNSLALHDGFLKVSVFYSAQNPLASKPNLTLADFMDQPFGVLASEISLDFRKRHLELFEQYGLKFTGRIIEYSARRHLQLGLISGQCFTVVYNTMFEDSRDKLLALELSDADALSKNATISIFWKNPHMEIKTRSLCDILRGKLTSVSQV